MAGVVGQTLQAQLSGVENWPVTMTDEPYIDKFKDSKQDLVGHSPAQSCPVDLTENVKFSWGHLLFEGLTEHEHMQIWTSLAPPVVFCVHPDADMQRKSVRR